MAKTKETRFVEIISPGFFFADQAEAKVPKELWDGDDEALAGHLTKKHDEAVAFRRITYSPSEGKLYKDKGWIYFKGVRIKRNDILSGKAEKTYPDLKLNDIARKNVEYNKYDVIWFRDYGKIWELDKDDKVLNCL